jgi:hypothetical protein
MEIASGYVRMPGGITTLHHEIRRATIVRLSRNPIRARVKISVRAGLELFRRNFGAVRVDRAAGHRGARSGRCRIEHFAVARLTTHVDGSVPRTGVRVVSAARAYDSRHPKHKSCYPLSDSISHATHEGHVIDPLVVVAWYLFTYTARSELPGLELFSQPCAASSQHRGRPSGAPRHRFRRLVRPRCRAPTPRDREE